MADKNLVIIKSFKNGLRLILDDSVPFSDIIAELSYKCNEGRTFFGNASTAISIEGREVTEDEEVQIIESINNNCDLNVICIVGREQADSESAYYNSIEMMQARLNVDMNDNSCTIYRGDLKDGDSIETEKPVLVLGNVDSGCLIKSSDCIIVLGYMYGEAVIKDSVVKDVNTDDVNKNVLTAGNSENNKKVHFVFSLDLNPERIEINDSVYRPDTKSKWGRKHKNVPKVALIRAGKIVLEEISKSVLEMTNAL